MGRRQILMCLPWKLRLHDARDCWHLFGVPRAQTFSIRPRFRVLRGADVALGPGKVELLEAIKETGSIAVAAKRMAMSYMRAWMLVRTMNACFKEPVVMALRGGPKHGGAVLTETGEKALELYQRMDVKSLKAVRPEIDKLKSLLR
jgi:molybdate transport system regulatory protein